MKYVIRHSYKLAGLKVDELLLLAFGAYDKIPSGVKSASNDEYAAVGVIPCSRCRYPGRYPSGIVAILCPVLNAVVYLTNASRRTNFPYFRTLIVLVEAGYAVPLVANSWQSTHPESVRVVAFRMSVTILENATTVEDSADVAATKLVCWM